MPPFAPAFILLALCAQQASAETPPSACETQADMAQMVECSVYHLGLAERDLGDALTALRSRYPQTATLLDQAQDGWASYRDATCYYVADPKDYGRGTETILDALCCKRTETLRRAAELRAMFTD